FIPLAEQSGLMNKLGEIVLRRAFADGARWPGLFVSVNLSPVQMRSRGLSYLQKFPFDRLKIDRAFVASLGTTGTTGAIIQSIVSLGHALGMKVLAEGIETNEQRVLLRLAGCDEMQGFLFAKACPAEAIDKILARPAAARAGPRRTAHSAS